MARPKKADHEVTPKALQMRKRRKHQNKERSRQISKKGWNKLRLEVLQHYSGSIPECRCCTETIFEFLHLDHGFGDGAEHRRQLQKTGTAFYCWVKNNWPDDLGLQVLCSNCDFGKKDKLYCPHELKRGVDLNGNLIPAFKTIDQMPTQLSSSRSASETLKEYQKRYRTENRERVAAVKKRATDAVRLECLQHYSSLHVPECRCCKETIFEFLQLDHVDGDGAAHKKFMINHNGKNLFGGAMYYHLRKSGFPDQPRLQVLCVKCNFGKRLGRYCPHELLRKIDMDGNPIPDEFYPPVLNWMPMTKGPERDAWLTSPEGLIFKQKQAETHQGKMVGEDHPRWAGDRLSVSCAACENTLERKPWEDTSRNKDGESRFFCDSKCAGAWKKKNLVGNKVYNHTPDIEFVCGYSVCGKQILRKQHQLRKGQTIVFCDKVCADKAKVGKQAWNKGKKRQASLNTSNSNAPLDS